MKFRGSWSGIHIALFGLLLRLLWLLLCPNEPTSDQMIYHNLASGLAQGNGYVHPDGSAAGWWPLGYPALLSTFYFIFGNQFTVGFAVNALLGAISILLCYLCGRDLVSHRAGLCAALLLCIHPTFLCYTTILASENAAIPAMLLFLWLCIRLDKQTSGKLLLTLLTGIVLGLAAYIRAPIILLGISPLLLALLFRGSLKTAFSTCAIIFAMAFTVLAPWGVRNQNEFGQFSFFSLNGSANFWMGNHEGTTGGYTLLPDGVHDAGLVEGERWLKNDALNFVKEHPLDYFKLCGQRIFMTLRSDTSAGTWNKIGLQKRFGESSSAPDVVALLCTGFHFLLLAGLLTSVFLVLKSGRWSREVDFLLLACGLSAIPFIFIVGGNRYHLPMMSIACIIAGILIAERSPESAQNSLDRG